jgi:hypothetical protein
MAVNSERTFVEVTKTTWRTRARKRTRKLVCFSDSAILRNKTPTNSQESRVIAQAVSRWLPTAAARVRAWVWSSGFCGRQSDAGAGFPRVLRLTLPVFIPPNSPSSQSPRAGKIGQKWPTCRVAQFGLHPPLWELNKLTGETQRKYFIKTNVPPLMWLTWIK